MAQFWPGTDTDGSDEGSADGFRDGSTDVTSGIDADGDDEGVSSTPNKIKHNYIRF